MPRISLSGAVGGAGTGAHVGAMFGPMGMGIGALGGGLLGLFSGQSLSREEQALLKRLQDVGQMQAGMAGQVMADGRRSAARFDQRAREVRSGPNAQVQNYWSALLGGDRAKMQSATAPQRQAIADTYRGGRRSLDRSNVRGPQRQKAEAEMARQETGQLAGLVQGVQPMAAQELGAMEANIQQIMAQYLGLGEQARTGAAYAAGNLLGSAGNTYQGMMQPHAGLRNSQSLTDSLMGDAFGTLLGAGQDYIAGRRNGGRPMNNRLGAAAPTPSGWTLPRAEMGTPATPNYFNATTRPRNPWGGIQF